MLSEKGGRDLRLARKKVASFKQYLFGFITKGGGKDKIHSKEEISQTGKEGKTGRGV